MKRLLISLLLAWTAVMVRASAAVVVDSLTNEPVAGATLFNRKGAPAGISDCDGRIPALPANLYPLTVKCMGFADKVLTAPGDSVIRLVDRAVELPEVVVNSQKDNVLHILALVREHSTLSTYTDTVTLFREKWVDFMVPARRQNRFRGWMTPRILSTRSYYRFTNAEGLDSVSDRFNQHFSWTDWVGIVDRIPIPDSVAEPHTPTFKLYGKYSPTEIWSRHGDDITLSVDVLADPGSRRWLPNLADFFRHNLDFERLRIRYSFADVAADTLYARDLTGISFNIESRGRGRSMFRFARPDEPFFVATYAEIFMVDKEYIKVSEARKWENFTIPPEVLAQMPVPDDLPDRHPAAIALIDRVNSIDHAERRSRLQPDWRMGCLDLTPLTFSQRLLKFLKGMAGL